MFYDKGKYERLILETQLFDIDKEKSPIIYDREKHRLQGFVYCYLMSINEKKYEPYSCEILNVLEDCIRSYDKNKGEFIHYFNSAWKKEYRHICGREIIQNGFSGMTNITEEERRQIVKIIRYREKVRKEDCFLSEEDILHDYSKLSGISIEKIRYIAEIESARKIDNYTINGDGERINIIEQIPDNARVEDFFTNLDSISEKISSLEEAFDKLQDRQKGVVADLLTAKLCPIIDEVFFVKVPSFISKSILESYNSTGIIPTQKEIGVKYGKAESSVSRTYKDFLEKVKIK